jgi:hypothetical protein
MKQLVITLVTTTTLVCVLISSMLVHARPVINQTSAVYVKLTNEKRLTLHRNARLKLEIECPVAELMSRLDNDNSDDDETKLGALVNWYRDERKINVFSSGRHIRIDHNQLSVDVSDDTLGLYSCELITGTGLQINSANLTLQYIDGINSSSNFAPFFSFVIILYVFQLRHRAQNPEPSLDHGK